MSALHISAFLGGALFFSSVFDICGAQWPLSLVLDASFAAMAVFASKEP